MIGILMLAFFAVAFGIPSCHWLIFGDYQPTHKEETLCRMFGYFNRNAGVLMFLLFLGRPYMGNLAYAIAAVLMVVLLIVYAWKLLHQT